MLGLDPSGQGFSERRQLGTQGPSRQISKYFGVAFPVHQRREHGSAAHPQDVGGYGGELQVRAFERLLQAIDLIRSLLDERLAVARQLAQGPDWCRREASVVTPSRKSSETRPVPLTWECWRSQPRRACPEHQLAGAG